MRIRHKGWYLNKMRSEDASSLFLSYGGDMMKEIIASFDGKSNPFRKFTAEEIISATDNFHKGEFTSEASTFFHGCFEGRSILVGLRLFGQQRPHFVRHFAVSSQLSHHKNALKLLGYCLEFKRLVAVYEDPGGLKPISNFLFRSDNINTLLPWCSRLRIANDIANILVYLHTAFSTPLIYWNMRPECILIDQFGVAKLFDFSYCLELPPGKPDIKAENIDHLLSVSTPRQYCYEGIVNTKYDVHDFGVVLLNLLTGCSISYLMARENTNQRNFSSQMKELMSEQDGFLKIVDRSLFVSRTKLEKEEQVQALLNLAIKCMEYEPTDRPEMIDVAKELKQIARKD